MVAVVQLGGAVTILAAFFLLQSGRMRAGGPVLFGLNLAGSVALGITAFLEAQWGFVVLETSWALLSVLGFVRRDRKPAAPTD